MIISPKYLLIAGLLAMAPAAARAATPTQTAPASTPSKAPAPAPVQKLFVQNFGDWSYRCLATASPGQPVATTCFVQQQLVISNNGHTSPLLTVTFFKGSTKGHTMNILTPLGVALRAGVEMSVDNGKSASSSYSFCNSNGCVVLGAPAYAITKDVRTAKTGHAKIGLMNDKPLTINFSLKGLSQALAALDSGVMPRDEVKPG
jgi:invasion protein IalB